MQQQRPQLLDDKDVETGGVIGREARELLEEMLTGFWTAECRNSRAFDRMPMIKTIL